MFQVHYVCKYLLLMSLYICLFYFSKYKLIIYPITTTITHPQLTSKGIQMQASLEWGKGDEA